MKILLVFFCAVTMCLIMTGVAGTIPIDFNIDGPNASIKLSEQTIPLDHAGSSNINLEDVFNPFSISEPTTTMFVGFGLIGLANFGRRKLPKIIITVEEKEGPERQRQNRTPATQTHPPA